MTCLNPASLNPSRSTVFVAATARKPPGAAARVALALAVAVISLSSMAAGPPPVHQAPGYYHQTIGPLRVTALFDGVVALGAAQLGGIDATLRDTLVSRSFVPRGEQGLQTAVNAYLVNDGRQLTLVDAGTARCFGPGLGQVPAHLRAAGYRPEQVDNVLLTHAHPDHLCGIADRNGRAVYPNATVWLARADADAWLAPGAENRPGTPDAVKPLFAMARKAVAPYQASRRLRLFDPDDTLPAGVIALSTPGHTPGHTAWLFNPAGKAGVDGKGGRDANALLVWGDVIHYHAVQFAHPEASFEFDANAAQAITSRRALLKRSSDEAWWVAGAHLPFPGLGHVRHDGDAYGWVPAEYSPLSKP